jgi:hypothetical protein
MIIKKLGTYFRFVSMRDALEYRKRCPICSSQLLIDDRYAETKIDWDEGKERTRLLWKTQDGEEMIIDPDSSCVRFVDKYFVPEYVVGTSNYSSQAYMGRIIPKAKKVYDGHLYERIGMTCDDCCQYHYLVKFVIDVGMKSIINIELNSETISIDDNKGTVHEIKNIYPTKETEYTYFTKGDRIYLDGTHVGEKSITLPLITLDLDNPTKTLERIRTLVLFS